MSDHPIILVRTIVRIANALIDHCTESWTEVVIAAKEHSEVTLYNFTWWSIVFIITAAVVRLVFPRIMPADALVFPEKDD
jgi:hypothetical protein